jgi:lipid-A-disaccharide synthase
MPRRVFMTVAEVSGDQHAAAMIRRLRQLDPHAIVEGLGGPAMAAAGATIHHETVSNAAMGWRGALRALEYRRYLRWTRARFAGPDRPDLLICVDSSGVNFHFARIARVAGVPVLYYIAPQVWASREGRLKTMRGLIDRVACIWQFEEEYFRRHGIEATYVGHPLFDELEPAEFRLVDPRKKYPNRPPIVGLLPGSRRSDAASNFPHILDVAERIYRAIPDVTFRIPTTEATHLAVSRRVARAGEAGMRSPPASKIRIGLDAFEELVPDCDLCITKSGTSTLHVAAFGVPMIVVYRVNPVLWHGIGRWLVKTRTFSMVNILHDANEHIVPEHVPWYGSNEPVAQQAINFLRAPDALLAQRQRLLQLIRHIDHPGASMNVARLVMEMTGGAGSQLERAPSSQS